MKCKRCQCEFTVGGTLYDYETGQKVPVCLECLPATLDMIANIKSGNIVDLCVGGQAYSAVIQNWENGILK